MGEQAAGKELRERLDRMGELEQAGDSGGKIRELSEALTAAEKKGKALSEELQSHLATERKQQDEERQRFEAEKRDIRDQLKKQTADSEKRLEREIEQGKRFWEQLQAQTKQ